MIRILKSSLFAVFFLSIAIFLPKNAKASEGVVELRSTTRETYRCYASSMLMQDQNYHVLVSCRELLYPAGDTVFTYVLWAQPTDGGAVRRLGELGFGRLNARINQPFSQLFVSTEPTAGVRAPSGPTVMRGNVQPISFLDRVTTPTPTSASSVSNNDEPTGSETVTPTPEGTSTGSRIATAFRRAGLAAFLALVALIGLVFAITRSRG